VILREFLPGLIGAQLTAELLERGPQLYRIDGDPYIPFEFADAAYRYVTPRSATGIGSTPASVRCRCSPTSWGSAR
jgi:hypothetical protein